MGREVGQGRRKVGEGKEDKAEGGRDVESYSGEELPLTLFSCSPSLLRSTAWGGGIEVP